MKYKDYIYLLLMLFIASLNFNLFLKPLELACGGTLGLSIIINKLIGIDNSIIILFINICMLLLSFILLNKKMTIGLFISTFIYPIFIYITSNINISFDIFILNLIIVSILSGITNGIIYKLGFSSSGIALLSPIINKYTNIKIGTINLFINIIITSLYFLLFGINKLIPSILVIVFNSLIINMILYKNYR